MNFLATKLSTLLIGMYGFIPNLGVVIILFTLILKSIILLFTYKSLKASHQNMGKMKEMNKELSELKKLYKDDPATFQVKQLEVSKRYNLNPFAGCIPQLVQLFVLIVFYQAIQLFVGMSEIGGVPVEANFLWLNLVEKDPLHILPIMAAGFQMLMSLMISQGSQVRDLVPNNSNKALVKKANDKEEDSAEMAASMQKQMMFMMPIMTGFIAWNMPAGVVLYWVISTIFGIFQQASISGWGRLKFWGNNNS